jgi:hypothetical protein
MAYGGMPESGGYGSYKEFEIGAARIAEAAHCILGSLGKWGGDWHRMTRIETEHLIEELHIIIFCVEEYARPVYRKRQMFPQKEGYWELLTPQQREDSLLYVNEAIADIRTVSPPLSKRALTLAVALNAQHDIPEPVKETALDAYAVIYQMAEAMLFAVKSWPKDLYNPYIRRPLRKAVNRLTRSVYQLLDWGNVDAETVWYYTIKHRREI